MKKIIAGLFAGLILTMGAQALAYGCEGGVCELPQGDSGGAYRYDDDGAYCWDDDGSYCYDDDDTYCWDDDDAYCYGDHVCGRGSWHRR